jgi:hypothetical protein
MIPFVGTIEDALLLDVKDIAFSVFVNGVLIPAEQARVRAAITQPVATCDIVTDYPIATSIPMGSVVEVQAGYGNAVGTIFTGETLEDTDDLSNNGLEGRIVASGWANRLVAPTRTDIIFPPGRISLKTTFDTLCEMREIPNYFADNTVELNNTTLIELAGVAEFEEGRLVIKKDTGILSWMQRAYNMFGYYVADVAPGVVRLMRVLDPPPEAEIDVTYTQGVDLVSIRRSSRSSEIINDWEIIGASWKDEEGNDLPPIRTFPLTVPDDPLLQPLGYRHGEIQDDLLVRLSLAESVRAAQEITHGGLRNEWQLGVEGDWRRGPGDAIKIVTPELGTHRAWITDLTQTVSAEGYWADITAWAGAGTTSPPGNDCVSVSIFTGIRHLGNEFLPNYYNDANQGTSYTIPFTIVDGYTSLVITGFAHGTNSFSRGQESTASRFEIWQGGKKVADGELPRQREDLVTNYTNLSKWPSIKVALSGSLKAGNAELRIIAGYDSAVGDTDDFEFRNLTLTACGVGSPIYPD